MDWLIKMDFLLVALMLMFISWRDITTRMISHKNLLLLTVALVPLFIVEKKFPNFISACWVFVVCFILFTLHIIGGGDVKLLTLLSLPFSSSALTAFLLTTAFWGGVIALFGLIFFNRNVRLHGVPYGLAISLAFISIYPITVAPY
ncbi:A24 family peptidase [Erwinia sp.]|uniref:A24 family peptidase n=1 Tax=Erwinia citreus TaxID=558 RepID=UPI003C766E43